MIQDENILIEDNRGLVKTIVQHFKPRNKTEFDEYEQAGLIGLMRAIRKHDPNKGKLSTIAFYYITGEISKYIKQEKKNIGIGGMDLELICYNRKLDFSDYFANLNNTERQVIDLKVEGYTFKEIGEKMGGYTGSWANFIYQNIIKTIKQRYIDT